MKNYRGFTLIELIVSIGLFALIMTLAAGAYLIIIGVNRVAQASATGINSLSFTLDDMTRSIRTGTSYNCSSESGGDCIYGGDTFYFTDASGNLVSYTVSNSATLCGAPNTRCIVKTVNGVSATLTDPSVDITTLSFYVTGTGTAAASDYTQPHVTFIIAGTVSTGPGKTKDFNIEAGASMRGIDL